MKNKITILLLFLFIYNISNAQFGMNFKKKAEEANIIKNTTLLVVLMDVNDRLLKREFKKNKSDEIVAYVNNYNKILKESFKNDWTFTKDVKFIKKSELKGYQNNKYKYSYFIDTKKGVTIRENLMYEIFLVGKKSPTFSFIYNEFPMTNADFGFLIQQAQLTFNNYIKYALNGKISKKIRKEEKLKFKENRKVIKSKILLLNSNELSKKVIKKMKDIYPYKFEIVTKSKIDKVIIEKNSEYLYLRVVQLSLINYGKRNDPKHFKNFAYNNGRYSVRIFDPKDGNQLIIPPFVGSSIVDFSTMKSVIKQIK